MITRLNISIGLEEGGGGTVDTTIVDGSANAVSGNAVFDALALKANLAAPTITGAWDLRGGYGDGGLRPFANAGLGYVGVGIYNFFGNIVGQLYGDNTGAFAIAVGSNVLTMGSTLKYSSFEGGGG